MAGKSTTWEPHLEGEVGVVHSGSRRTEGVFWVLQVHQPGLLGGEGDLLAGGGHAGVQDGRGPGLVPGAHGRQLLVQAAVGGLEAAVGPAGVEHLSAVVEVPAPLPGAHGGLQGWGGAVHSWGGGGVGRLDPYMGGGVGRLDPYIALWGSIM